MEIKPKDHIIPFLKIVLNPIRWWRFIKNSIVNFPHTSRKIFSFVIFFIILSFFIVKTCYSLLMSIPLLGRFFRKMLPVFRPITNTAQTVIARLETFRTFQVRQSYLVEIAFGNLQSRKNRTLITILGMATGVGIIVYLLSLGYGIERLVVSQVASLDELRIVDVAASQNTALKMNSETVKKIRAIDSVNDVVPLISLVGRVSFQKAQTDVLVYAADEKFMEISQLNLKKGKVFTDAGSIEDLISMTDFDVVSNGEGVVAGAASDLQNGHLGALRYSQPVPFNLIPKKAVPVWSECSISSDVIGYTTRLEAPLYGKKMWGSTYAPYSPHGRTGYDKQKDTYLGSWIAAKVPLFATQEDDTLVPKIAKSGYQLWETGCIQDYYVQYEDQGKELEAVLGIASDAASAEETADVLAASTSATLERALADQGLQATGSAIPAFDVEVVSTDSSGIEFVQLVSSEEAQLKAQNASLGFTGKPIAQAIISTGLMKLLNIPEKDILKKTFTVSFIVSESLKPDVRGRQLSEEVKYNIIGLIDDDESQYFYVPFSDIRKLGVQNFSQLKVVLENENGVAGVRTKIETFGYNTTSVIDTVSQIESLFGTIRLVLGAIGLIALGVASLGMFNTLTVSLLERTREIGGMKVIGMVSEEIQDLFLAEAMIMGFSGGLGGLFLGYLFGQVTSMFVSVFSIAQGLGYLNLTYIPLMFTLSILILSFIVGIVTGMYPAKRARSISALNALRYE